MNSEKILFIGCGNMGKAILTALLKHYTHAKFFIIDPSFTTNHPKVSACQARDAAQINPDIILIAVKPQTLPEVSAILKASVGANTLLISIMAGVTSAKIAEAAGSNKIARVMPNIAAVQGSSTSSCYLSPSLSKSEREAALTFIRCFGSLEVLDNEDDMHISTIINGGAMAYLALIMSCIKQSAATHSASLTKQQIHNLLYRTCQNLIELSETKSEAEIIKLICSKKGTTEAVITELKTAKLDSIINKAIVAGIQRSRDLDRATP